MGADLAYLGTRFIGTAECRSPEDYKTMILDSRVKDIVETDRVSGVNANFLAASLAEAGIARTRARRRPPKSTMSCPRR